MQLKWSMHMAIQGTAVRTIWLKASAGLLLGALGATWAGHSHAEATLQVPTIRLQTRRQNASLEWDGTIQAVKQGTVAAQVAGNIVALLVKAGDSVKAGQVMARIDERDTQASLNRSQADLAQADAQLTNARLQWERSQALKAQGFISGAALDSAQAQWKAAQAAMAAAQAGRAQAALARSFATVTAPFDGKVLSTQADVGDLAAPGRPILTLYAPRPLRAVVQVPASQSDQMRMAKAAEVAVPGATDQGSTPWLKATRIVSLPGADPVSQTIEWRLDLPDVNALPGQTVRVRFTGIQSNQASDTPATTGLTVPARAVLQRGELTAVYVVREGRFVLQAVRIASTSNASADVTLLSGAKAGDVIALDAIKAGLSNASPMKP
jgi:RND family efflux transporter MFP subunit